MGKCAAGYGSLFSSASHYIFDSVTGTCHQSELVTHSRLRQRVAEIGVRRSFGATRGGVMGQIVAENLVLTLMAGVLGLLFCLIISYCWGGTLFADSRLMYLNTAPVIEWKMLLNFLLLFMHYFSVWH